jgi:uncharacterized protein DUF5679
MDAAQAGVARCRVPSGSGRSNVPTAPSASSSTRPSKRHRRRLRRLEARLGKVRAQEQRRTARLERARDAGGTGEITRRTRRLERTRARGERLAAAIAKLQAPAADGAAIEAYCLRDRSKVAMVDPVRTTMRTGQPALVGTCPRCGGRLVRAVSRDAVAG